ncbi:hypothetical protein [Novosphingobium sp.]|uniref:hypothetical protein n=1 Tax=Novosphingobium sp. TaxID=1874826 RepID=UPI00262AAC70|nr:hypothetical protein [Novosphingobium sp.]
MLDLDTCDKGIDWELGRKLRSNNRHPVVILGPSASHCRSAKQANENGAGETDRFEHVASVSLFCAERSWHLPKSSFPFQYGHRDDQAFLPI